MPLPAMSGALPWIGSYSAWRRPMGLGRPSVADGQHPETAGEHGGEIRQEVAEQVGGDDHVELARVADQLHGAVVGIHVRQCNVGIFARVQGRDGLAP